MTNAEFILIGGGQHAKVVYDGMVCMDLNVVAVFDPNPNKFFASLPLYQQYDPSIAVHAKAIISIGNNSVRQQVQKIIKHTFANFVHASSIRSPNVTLGIGCMIMSGAILQVDTQIGDHVLINTGASIDHDCKIGSYAHVAPGAILCGSVAVGEGTLIGAGSVVLPGIEIGNWARIGAGSVVTKNVPAGVTVVGNPARIINKEIV